MVHKKGKKHPFKETHILHHDDGSASIHHVHESDPKKDVKSGVPDHDALIDHILDHTGPEAPTGAPPASVPSTPAGPMPGAPMPAGPMGQ